MYFVPLSLTMKSISRIALAVFLATAAEAYLHAPSPLGVTNQRFAGSRVAQQLTGSSRRDTRRSTIEAKKGKGVPIQQVQMLFLTLGYGCLGSAMCLLIPGNPSELEVSNPLPDLLWVCPCKGIQANHLRRLYILC